MLLCSALLCSALLCSALSTLYEGMVEPISKGVLFIWAVLCACLSCSILRVLHEEMADLSWDAGRPPYPIHRLDMYTSGVVIVAKHASVVQRLHELFR